MCNLTVVSKTDARTKHHLGHVGRETISEDSRFGRPKRSRKNPDGPLSVFDHLVFQQTHLFLMRPAGCGSRRKWELDSERFIASPWRVPKFGKRFFEPSGDHEARLPRDATVYSWRRRPRLFVPQGGHRIHTCRRARRNITRHKRHADQEPRHQRERKRVAWRHSKKHTR